MLRAILTAPLNAMHWGERNDCVRVHAATEGRMWVQCACAQATQATQHNLGKKSNPNAKFMI